jgi:V8-like Glu-specific endopeptidase
MLLKALLLTMSQLMVDHMLKFKSSNSCLLLGSQQTVVNFFIPKSPGVLRMKNVLLAKITGVLFAVFTSQVNAYAQLTTKGTNGINQYITKSSVLLATPGGNGSGTVVGIHKGRLIIVTAKHAIEGVAQGEEVDIYNNEGKKLGTAKGSQIRKSSNADVAIIFAERTGKACVVPATLGKLSNMALSKLNPGNNITVAGYASTDDALTRKPVFRISRGAVTSILSEREAINGYQFSYDSATARGMSGGGVFANGAVLIGIHGSGERDELRSFAKTGFNYAIPSNNAYELLRASLGEKFSQARLADITIRSGNVLNTLSTVCTDPFGKWYCSTSGNDQTGANDQVCYLGSGELKHRKKIIIEKGKCGFGSHPLCGLVPGYE